MGAELDVPRCIDCGHVAFIGWDGMTECPGCGAVFTPGASPEPWMVSA